MNARRILLDIISPSPLPKGVSYRRTLYWEDGLGQTPVPEPLVSLVLKAAERAGSISLSELDDRCIGTTLHRTWPGEHYRFLAGLVDVLQAEIVIELGTFTGLASLAMLSRLPTSGRITTFDIVPWDKVESPSHFRKEDFVDGRLVQYTDNLADKTAFEKHRNLLESADLIFLDGPKDGKTEEQFMRLFETLNSRRKPVLVFDDIRDSKMLRIWHDIAAPKYDVTSLGHWTGTGLVLWQGPAQGLESSLTQHIDYQHSAKL